MRPALRMLASVKPVAASGSSKAAASRYIQPVQPTGLTGLRSGPSPRSSLMYLYSMTLDKLKGAPESSLYRQSVENLTKHRLQIVESVVPEGWEEWSKSMEDLLEKNKATTHVSETGVFTLDGALASVYERAGRTFIAKQTPVTVLEDDVEWDGEKNDGGELEGSRTEEERKEQILIQARRDRHDGDLKGWVQEPQLTAQQVAEIEDRIASGLIEELIEVAEGELKLADVMLQSKAWESLEEKPVEGQWTYFARKSA